MKTSPKSSWPKTREGVTDWQAVFEDPESGYIPRVERATDPHALRAAVLVAIENLFTRKEDKKDVAAFAAELQIIFAKGDIAEIKTAVATLMRGIKSQRIEKAARYVEKQRQGKKAERRVEKNGGSGLTMAPFKALGLNRKETGILFGSFFVAAVACLLGFGVLVFVQYLDGEMADGPKGKADNAKPPEVTHVKAVEEAPRKPSEMIIQKPRDDLGYQFRVDGPPLYITVHPEGRRAFKALYLPTLFLVSDEERLHLCRNWPKVLDALNVTLSRVHPARALATDKHLNKANRLAAKVINQTIGLDLVSWVTYEVVKDTSQLVARSRKACVVEKIERKSD